MTFDNEFLTAMHIKPESAPTTERTDAHKSDDDFGPFDGLSAIELHCAAVRWCKEARAQYQENQVLRTRICKLQDTATFLVIAAGILTLALIGVCWGCL